MDRVEEISLTKQQSLYIDEYLKKSKDDICDFMTKRDSKVLDVPGVGWVEYQIVDNIFWIWTAFAKTEHSITKLVWNRIIKKAKKFNCDKIQFITNRNPKAFKRLFNLEPIQWKLELKLSKEE